MVGKTSAIVSFVGLLSAWIAGLALALFFEWKIPFLSLNHASFLDLFWLGLVVLVFCMMFFGRLGFLLFLALGAVQAFSFSSSFFLAFFFQALVLAWFGMLGVLVGEMLFDDLSNKKDFNLLNRYLVIAFVLGILLAFFVAFFSGALQKAGTKLYEIAKKIRNREFSFGNILDFFQPADYNAQPAEPTRPTQPNTT